MLNRYNSRDYKLWEKTFYLPNNPSYKLRMATIAIVVFGIFHWNYPLNSDGIWAGRFILDFLPKKGTACQSLLISTRFGPGLELLGPNTHTINIETPYRAVMDSTHYYYPCFLQEPFVSTAEQIKTWTWERDWTLANSEDGASKVRQIVVMVNLPNRQQKGQRTEIRYNQQDQWNLFIEKIQIPSKYLQ